MPDIERSSDDLFGMRVIVSEAVERDTLHVMPEPPRRENHATEEDYDRALGRWLRTQVWTLRSLRTA